MAKRIIQELIDIRQDPEYTEIKPVIRKTLDQIYMLEEKLYRVRMLCETIQETAKTKTPAGYNDDE
tara:strand:+ start:480 stop:677 length:198 start_codon:yes stop_codon:yes gene_type:complete